MADDDDLDLENGGDAGKKTTPVRSSGSRSSSRGPGRPSSEAKARDLKQTIEEGLGELAEWLGDGEVGTALRDGAPRMAKVLSARAAKHARVGKVLGIVFAADGPLAILRAFGPLLRAVGDKIPFRDREVQFVDEHGFVVDPDTGLQVLDEQGAPIRGDT
jgi:hypothetical protein